MNEVLRSSQIDHLGRCDMDQMLVVGQLNTTDVVTERLILPKESRARQIVEDAREGLIGILRKRWMQIRQENGFTLVLEHYLRDISESEPDFLTMSVGQRILMHFLLKRYT